MAVLNSTTWRAPPFTKSFAKPSFSPILFSTQLFSKSNQRSKWSLSTRKRRNLVIGSVTEDREVVPVKDKHSNDQENRLLLDGSEDYNALSSSSSISINFFFLYYFLMQGSEDHFQPKKKCYEDHFTQILYAL